MKREFSWDRFFKLVNAGNVVPVIGSEIIRLGSGEASLYNHLQKELSKEKDLDKEDLTLMEFVEKYKESHNVDQAEIKSVYDKIPDDKYFLKPLEKLARITDFTLYLSTSFDDIFQQILEKVRTNRNDSLQTYSHSLINLAADDVFGASIKYISLLGNIGQHRILLKINIAMSMRKNGS